MSADVAIIGGGLAGCECAWQLSRLGVKSVVFEMKPDKFSPAHTSENLAELVCSNSFRSIEPHTAVGLLKLEMRGCGSLVMRAADATKVPAGQALAVDRELFSGLVTKSMEECPEITVERREILSLNDPDLADFSRVVLAVGPLAGDSLAMGLQEIVGQERLFFYDAIAPIVDKDSVDMDKAFRASRYGSGPGDYLNCPMTEEEYLRFREALLGAAKAAPRAFEDQTHFEGCLPIETLAERGEMTMAFGPLKPVGLEDPRTGRRPFAVVQLRAENLQQTAFNMVGFQTKLTYGEQKRVFRMIPGLERAEFPRLGSIHRNTFVNAPKVLTPELMLNNRSGAYLAGQITGVEGYVESAACGLWLGLHLGAELGGGHIGLPPVETALGALLSHLRTETKNFQPSNVQFGLMPPLNVRAGKKKRKELYAKRGREKWGEWMEKEVGPLLRSRPSSALVTAL